MGHDPLLQVREVDDASVRAALSGYRTYAITDALCSCCLIDHVPKETTEKMREKFRAQYKKKGWQEAKISRALSDWSIAHEGRSASQSAQRDAFYELLRALLREHRHVKVLAHNFDREEVVVSSRVQMSVDSLQGGSIPEDTIIDIIDPLEEGGVLDLQQKHDAMPARSTLPLLQARGEPWYLNFAEFRSPHDAWLKCFKFSIEGEDPDEEKCFKTLEIVLLAAYHNGTITLTYRNVKTYNVSLKKEQGRRGSGRHDWLQDTVVVASGMIQHRIEWDGETWLIEAEEITYEWNKFSSFTFK
jgi:hypothetical protein